MNRVLIVLFSGLAGLIMGASVTPRAHGLTLKGFYAPEDQGAMVIKVVADGRTIVFQLNDSTAARALYAQLPFSINVKNYSTNEKIFYPPKKLDTSGTALADARTGTLAYYAPWGNVVMFYGSFGSAAGLYELGHAISGSAYIQNMSGTIQIDRANMP